MTQEQGFLADKLKQIIGENELQARMVSLNHAVTLNQNSSTETIILEAKKYEAYLLGTENKQP